MFTSLVLPLELNNLPLTELKKWSMDVSSPGFKLFCFNTPRLSLTIWEVLPGDGRLLCLPYIHAAHLGTEVIVDKTPLIILLLASVLESTPDLNKYISLLKPGCPKRQCHCMKYFSFWVKFLLDSCTTEMVAFRADPACFKPWFVKETVVGRLLLSEMLANTGVLLGSVSLPDNFNPLYMMIMVSSPNWSVISWGRRSLTLQDGTYKALSLKHPTPPC